jgi:hypothetical protein
MSQFTTPFIGELIGKNLWKNYQPFEYHIGTYPSDEIITVPAGFKTNFASVPRIFWPILSPIDDHGKAAVIHDYCYAKGLYNRRISDKIFREGLRVLNVKSWKVFCMYYGLRMFGWIVWWKYRLREKRERL